MVATVGDEENGLVPLHFRGDHGDVGQMAPAFHGVIGHPHVAGLEGGPLQGPLPPDRLPHGSQMDRLVRRVGHEVARRPEHRAGVILPFLDVGGDRGALQRPPHLFRDRHEPVAEDRELDGIVFRPDPAESLLRNVYFHVAGPGDPRRAFRFHHQRGGRMDQNRRTGNRFPGAQPFEPEHRRFPPAALEIARTIRFRRRGRLLGGERDGLQFLAPPHRPHSEVVDPDLPLFQLEPEFPSVMVEKRPFPVAVGRLGDHDRGVGSPVPQVEITPHLGLEGPLPPQFLQGVRRQSVQPFEELLPGLGAQDLCGGLLFFRRHIGQPQPVGRQDAGEPVDEDAGNAQDPGQGAGVLPARSAETGQHVVLEVVSPGDRDFPNRPRHGFVGHLDKPIGHLFRGSGRRTRPVGLDLPGQFLEGGPSGPQVQGLVFARTEHLGEIVRQKPAQEQVGIG